VRRYLFIHVTLSWNAIRATPVDKNEFTANLQGLFTHLLLMTLPASSYEVSASTEHGFREVEGFRSMLGGRIPVAEHRCWETDISLIADGKLAGRVRGADGKPATFVKVAIIPISPVRAQFTVVTDKNGYFEARGRQPGQYLSRDRASGTIREPRMEVACLLSGCRGQYVLTSFHKPIGSEAGKPLGRNDQKHRIEVFQKELISVRGAGLR
jgi:hypothetical protein